MAIGLAVGWALFDLFPNPLVQSMFAVVAGVVFFINRTTRYTLSTAAITLMILFCFNQVGDGYGLFLPRLFDTLVGSVIAAAAVSVLLDWQGRRLNQVLANTLSCNSQYLRQIMHQYAQGKSGDPAYRLARRNAHNADAALSTTLANMLDGAGALPKGCRYGLPLFGAFTHPAQLFVGPGRAPRHPVAQRHSRALDRRRGAQDR